MPIPLSPGQKSEHLRVAGPVGNLEVVLDFPSGDARGIALIAHPHPLYGGSLDNKVAQTLAKTLVELGYVSLRSNFRGVGASEGEHGSGTGEVDDLVFLAGYVRERFNAQTLGSQPIVLAGFSFGAFVQTQVGERLRAAGHAIERMILVGVADGDVGGGRSYRAAAVPNDTIVIHGEVDDTVPLANVLAWARPQELPVIVAPGCDHFFNRKLHVIRAIIKNQWR
ncbi:MAG: alpha/beta hydrolase [Burkholderiales bacterium]